VDEKKGYVELGYNSIRLVLWWEACGFSKKLPHASHRDKGYAPHTPDAVLHTNDAEVYAAFIRGLFEADGTMGSFYVSWTTTTLAFSREVQALLLALGFVTTRKVEKPSRTSWGISDRYVLRLLNVASVPVFLQQIGFISERKNTPPSLPLYTQSARFDQIPMSRQMVDRLAPNNDRLRKILLMSLARTGTISRRRGEELQTLLNFFYDEVATLGVVNSLSLSLGSQSYPAGLKTIVNGFPTSV
jgi:ribonucleoside-diphosphate reductase alpha chain